MSRADDRSPESAPRSFGGNPFEKLRGRYAPGQPAPIEPSPNQPSPNQTGRPDANERTPATRGRVIVRRETKGRGGKTITRVSGLALGSAALEALARELKRALGCGALVEGDELLLQGAQSERAAAWLRERGWTDVRLGN